MAQSSTKHKMCKTRFHRIWSKMGERCGNPNSINYARYGGKGVFVCNKWNTFLSFKEDMYESYLEHVEKYGEKNTQLDRVNSKHGYEPKNCRWVTLNEQAQNKSSNLIYTFNNESLCLKEWCRRLDISYHKTYLRIRRYGWDVSTALELNV